jgi:nicotinate-nucleotide--dimethylbenzimidazole phosphoribosyltransferase
MRLEFQLPAVPELSDAALSTRLQHTLDQKTKPLGSLGQLETLAHRIGLILGTAAPRLRDPQVVVFAGDHGLAAQGVSAYPSDVTWQMVENFLAGGAAVSVLSRLHDLGLVVVDCGVRHEFKPRTGLLVRKVAPGTADASQGPAMTQQQCQLALANGQDLVRHLNGNVLLVGRAADEPTHRAGHRRMHRCRHRARCARH